MAQGRQDEPEPSAFTIPVDPVGDLEQRLPGTRQVISRGVGCCWHDPGQQRHPRYAHERSEDADLMRQPERGWTRPRGFRANRSLMTALDECYSGSPCPHFSSSRGSIAGPIADAKSAATTSPRAADPTCGNSSPQGRAYGGVAPRSGHSALLAAMIKPSSRKHRVGRERGLQRSDHRLFVTVCHRHLPAADRETNHRIEAACG